MINIKGSYTTFGDTFMTNEGLVLRGSAAYMEFVTDAPVTMDITGPEEGPEDSAQFIAVFENGSETVRHKLAVGRHSYAIFSGHETTTVRVIKITEFQYGDAVINDIRAEGELSPTVTKDKTILVIGDSISAGYGVEGDENEEVFSTRDENVMKSYSYLTPQLLNMNALIYAASGNGLTTTWIPPEVDVPQDKGLMPEIFPDFAERITEQKLSIPYVVINLGTNDFSYTRGIKDREERFESRFVGFLGTVRKYFPNSYIIMAYGMMDRTLIPNERNIMQRYQTETGDSRCSFIELPGMAPEDGRGAQWHPSPITDIKAAKVLASYINDR